jgi:hypothetical protein
MGHRVAMPVDCAQIDSIDGLAGRAANPEMPMPRRDRPAPSSIDHTGAREGLIQINERFDSYVHRMNVGSGPSERGIGRQVTVVNPNGANPRGATTSDAQARHSSR